MSPATTTARAHARTTVDAIRERRRDHPALDRFPDPDDPLGVIAYLTTYPQVSPDAVRADALDQLTLLRCVRAVEEEHRLKTIRRARAAGVTWKELAGPLGVRSAQGAEQTALRLANLLEGSGRRDEKAGRDWRRDVAAPRPVVAADREPDPGPLRQLVARLLKLRGGLPDSLAEDVGDLRSEATEARAEMGYHELRGALRLLIADLRKHPVNEQLRAVLEDGAELLVRIGAVPATQID